MSKLQVAPNSSSPVPSAACCRHADIERSLFLLANFPLPSLLCCPSESYCVSRPLITSRSECYPPTIWLPIAVRTMNASHRNRNAANAGLRFSKKKQLPSASRKTPSSTSSPTSTRPSTSHPCPTTSCAHTYVPSRTTPSCVDVSSLAIFLPPTAKRDKSNHLKLIQHVWGRQWNWAARKLPLWLAPNMVTLIGFFFILGNVGLLVLFVPDLVGPVRLAQEAPSYLITPRA